MTTMLPLLISPSHRSQVSFISSSDTASSPFRRSCDRSGKRELRSQPSTPRCREWLCRTSGTSNFLAARSSSCFTSFSPDVHRGNAVFVRPDPARTIEGQNEARVANPHLNDDEIVSFERLVTASAAENLLRLLLGGHGSPRLDEGWVVVKHLSVLHLALDQQATLASNQSLPDGEVIGELEVAGVGHNDARGLVEHHRMVQICYSAFAGRGHFCRILAVACKLGLYLHL